jgi:hypothetical protein
MAMDASGGRTISLHGVVHPTDSMTIVLNPAAKLVRTEIETDLEGAPIHLEVSYSSLPDGVVYPANTTLRVPKKKLEVRIATFNYQRQTVSE